ncbi:hypothetical protein G7062_02285 [Erysipelothrix sp. HDW6C]|uniref:hypothetical protein n=1 Tax=Erysipelothrix sp. HDW6C TaxID=2714930 RepID=UPI00140E20DB|nr:hypothetical protein [Erysipelothrix sp. HDW6C]QIK69185.1 hypothetical protein G7062_02285 [Erysipelothrix sp. HDW6C]
MKRRLFIILISFVFFLVPIYSEEETVIPLDKVDEINEPGVYHISIPYVDNLGRYYEQIVTLRISQDDIDKGIQIDTEPSPTIEKPPVETLPATGYTELLSANNIQLRVGITKTLTDNELIQIAQAKAWRSDTLAAIPIEDVVVKKTSDLTYSITFSTRNGATITIHSTETKISDDPIQWDDEAMEYRSFESFTYMIITMSVIFLLLVPLGIVTITYFYIQRKTKKAEQTLYSSQAIDH